MRKKIVLMLAAAASLSLVPAPSHAATTCAVADPTVDAVVCGIVFETVFEACSDKPLNKVCENLG